MIRKMRYRFYTFLAISVIVVISWFCISDRNLMSLPTLEKTKTGASFKSLEYIKRFVKSVQSEEASRSFAEGRHALKNDRENKVRILCFVMTIPANYYTKALAVNNTWARRCTKTIFVTTESSGSFHSMQVDVKEGRQYLTQKTVKTLQAIYKIYRHNFDWFFKCDDDVYVIMENLKQMLLKYDLNVPIYLGHHFKLFTKQGYMSGGSGYLMNRKAFIMLNEKGFNVPNKCPMEGKDEDLDIGKCFDRIGVKPYSTVDLLNRHTFHPFGLHKAMTGLTTGELNYLQQPYSEGPSCCSEFSITFHYVTPEEMYLMEYLLYHTTIKGRQHTSGKKGFLFSTNVSVIQNKKEDEILVPGNFGFLSVQKDSGLSINVGSYTFMSKFVLWFCFSHFIVFQFW